MTKKIYITTLGLLFWSIQATFCTEVQDTTVYFRDKVILISDSVDQINIKVNVQNESGVQPYKTVFEGIYTDNKTYERWSVAENWGIQIPFVTNHLVKKKELRKMTPHWAGWGYGFATMTDGTSYNNVNGMQLILGRSHEFNCNFMEHITPIFFNIVGLTSGLGLSFHNYYMDNSLFLKESNGITTIFSNSPLEYKYSKLKTFHVTVPLLLELQTFNHTKYKPYLAAGVVGGVKISSIYKTKYYTTTGSTKKTSERGMNVFPLSFDCLVMGGYGKVSIYAKYSPLDIFEIGKGPKVQHAAIGFMLDM